MQSYRHSARTVLLATCSVCLACAPPRGAYSARAIASYAFTDRDGLVMLPVRVAESEPRTFVLDTGASPCVLDSAFAASAGVASAPSARERQGGAGSFKSRVATSPVTVRIGGQDLSCHETTVLDLGGLTSVVGERIAGIIGGDFFRGRIVRIDYARSLVSVFKRGDYDPGASTKIPIRVDGNRAYLTALLSVPGGPQKAPRQLLIDTGSSDYVDDRVLTESSQSLRAVTPTGLGSNGTASVGTFSEVVIGPHTFHDIPGVAGNVSIVGAGVLTKFNLVFDYDGGWIDLEKRER